MAKSFAITTTATEQLKADSKGHAQAVFTVTNTTIRPVRGLAKPKPLGDTKREWLSLEGEAERDFAAGSTHQFTVNFDGPVAEPATKPTATTTPPTTSTTAPSNAAAPARKCTFRLDVESAQNPDEDYAEGPEVTVELPSAPVVNGTRFPVWIIFAILGAVLLIGGLVLFLVLRNRGGGNANEIVTEPSPSPEVSPTATSTPTPTVFQVTSATLTADPQTQSIPCSTVNFNGSISVNAPGTVTFTLVRSNGQTEARTLTFNEAGTQTVNMKWVFPRLHLHLIPRHGPPGPIRQPTPFNGWVKILVSSPNQMESSTATFSCR